MSMPTTAQLLAVAVLAVFVVPSAGIDSHGHKHSAILQATSPKQTLELEGKFVPEEIDFRLNYMDNEEALICQCDIELPKYSDWNLRNTQCVIPSRLKIYSASTNQRARRGDSSDEVLLAPLFAPKLHKSGGAPVRPVPTPFPPGPDPVFQKPGGAWVERMLGGVGVSHVVPVFGGHFGCVDGRQSDPTMLRTLGGDFAEFALYLNFVHQRNMRQTQMLVDRAFREYIDTPTTSEFRQTFYYHTDVDALRRIQKSLGLPSTEEDPLIDLTQIPIYLRNAVLKALSVPENQGCAHLRMMMQFPSDYGIDPQIIVYLLNSYFKLLWNDEVLSTQTHDARPFRDRLKLVVAEGHHHEKGWVNVKPSEECDEEAFACTVQVRASLVPAVDELAESPFQKNLEEASVDLELEEAKKAEAPVQLFQYHPKASYLFRQHLAYFYMRSRPPTLSEYEILEALLRQSLKASAITTRLLMHPPSRDQPLDFFEVEVL